MNTAPQSATTGTQPFTAQINYSFAENSLTINIVVSNQKHRYQASDGNSHEGYAILSGSGTYQYNGQQYSLIIAPQNINPYNVLWATPTDGVKNSSYGIDTNGIAIEGDNGNLSSDSPGGRAFWINTGVMNQAVTLSNVTGWPISQGA